MRPKNTLRYAASLKQHKGQQNGIAHGSPNGPDGIAAAGNGLDKHRIDGHTYQNEQPLEAHGKQGLQVVLSCAAQLPVGEGRYGDGGQAGEQIDLQHTAIGDNENNNAQNCPHTRIDRQKKET